jgi:t-SNARE complex subunit (syntaxin)
MKKQLEQMSIDLRELMVYQSPPELGALYTEVEDMMKQMGKEQKVLITQQIQRQAVEDKRKQARLKKLRDEFVVGVAVIVIIFVMGGVFMYVAYDRQQKYPQYGDGLLPRDPNKKEEKQIYIGR